MESQKERKDKIGREKYTLKVIAQFFFNLMKKYQCTNPKSSVNLNRKNTKRSIPRHVFFFFNINLFILFYLFLSELGLCCCMWVFSSCREWELLFVAVGRLLIAVVYLVAEHRL